MSAPALAATGHRLLDHALGYAARGWPVIPLHTAVMARDRLVCSCGRGTECPSQAKHPRTEHGLTDASTDPETIRGWWRQWPTANVGIVTGRAAGVVVLDVDPDKGGEESIARVLAEDGEGIPDTPESDTGGGGWHVLFARPEFQNVPNANGENGWLGQPGLDVRGDGGYIVAPPSLHISGRRYAWRPWKEPDIPLAPMPGWMLDRLRAWKDRQNGVGKPAAQGRRDDAATHWLGRALAMATVGERNQTGIWLACQLRDAGVAQGKAERTMRDYVARCPRGDKPYTEREALASCAQAFSRPAREPARKGGVTTAGPTRAEATAKPVEPKPPAPASASAELESHLHGITSGAVVDVGWPWPVLTLATAALLPGCSTVICGEAGVGKTFLVLQCLRYWRAAGVDVAVFFVEKDRKFHTLRLLAQLEGDGRFVDYKWLRANADEVGKAMDRHRDEIDTLGKCIWSEPTERVTLPDMLNWVRQMASAGKRVLMIDPITAANGGQSRWIADEDFMLGAQAVLTQHACSLVMVTHPKQVGRPVPSAHGKAGGAAYARFCDTDLWLHRPDPPKGVRVRTPMGPTFMDRIPLFMQMHKTRNGRGAGKEIAFRFGDGLLFSEQGIVLKDKGGSDE